MFVGHTCRGSLSVFQGHALVGAPKGSLPSPLKLCQNATLKRSLHNAPGTAQRSTTPHGTGRDEGVNGAAYGTGLLW